MTRAKLSCIPGVFGLLFSLLLYGCARLPDVRGVYRGQNTETDSGCVDPSNNQTGGTTPFTVNVTSQTGADFSGTAQSGFPSTLGLKGQVTANGGVSGTLTGANGTFAFQATFDGTLTGNTMTANYTGRFTAGETCAMEGRFTVTR